MIDASTQARFAADMERTGWKFLAQETSGGNVRALREVPWEAVMAKVMQVTGWLPRKIEVVREGDEADVIPLHDPRQIDLPMGDDAA